MNRVQNDDTARDIGILVCDIGLRQLKAEDFIQWHSYALERCYITAESQFEFGVRLSRGWDTDMTFSLRSHADESVDRLTDRAIDAIMMETREALNDLDDTTHHLDENEYLTHLHIRRFEEITGTPADPSAYSYTVEYDTVTHESLVVTDERVGGVPRVAGRRLLAGDVWRQYVYDRADDNPPENQYEALAEEHDDVITPDEAEAIVEYAKNNTDTFDEPSEILGDDETFTPL